MLRVVKRSPAVGLLGISWDARRLAATRRLWGPKVLDALRSIRDSHPDAYRLLLYVADTGGRARCEVEAAARLDPRNGPGEMEAVFATGRCEECDAPFIGRPRQRFCTRRCGDRNRQRGRERAGNGKSAAENALRRVEARLQRHSNRCQTCLTGDPCPEARQLWELAAIPQDALSRQCVSLPSDGADRLPVRRSRGR
jgi:hypothetical protein